MSEGHLVLRDRLVELKTAADLLSQQLRDASAELRQTGIPPCDELRTQLAEFCSDWDELQITLHEHSGSTASSVDGTVVTLKGLEARLDDVQFVSVAARFLNDVAEIRLADGTVSPELTEVHRQVSDTAAHLKSAEGMSIAVSVVDGKHPCGALHRLLRDGDTLANREWLELQERIQSAFGETVATSAARGKLTMPPTNSTDGDDLREATFHRESADKHGEREDVVVVEEHAVVPEEQTEPDSDPRHSEDDGTRSGESIFDDTESPQEVTGPALIVDRSVTLSDVDADEPAVRRSVEPCRSTSRTWFQKKYHEEQGAVYAAALAARTAADEHRNRHVTELIVHLVRQNRIGLAYHLARGLESQAGCQEPHLPSWVLRALAVSADVTYAKGRLAALLEEDFRQQQLDFSQCFNNEWSEALAFFVCAAALRPAVVAPGTRAAAILRTFPQSVECTNLYNYCARISANSEQLQGMMPSLFKQSRADGSTTDRVETLQAEVGEWRDALTIQSVQYEPAEPLFLHNHWSVKAGTVIRHASQTRLWLKWQQTLRLVDGIVDHIIQGDDDGRHDVRTEITRLEKIVRLGSAQDQATTPGGDGLVFVPLAEMYEAIREAMTFGQRWLSLDTAVSVDGMRLLPQEAEELRADVLARHNDVIEELARYRDRSRSLVIQVGVECLMRSIQNLRDLVDPQGDVSSTEPLPRHLLHAELLRIPSLSLDASWEPELAAETLSRQIVRFLTEPQPDWITALQHACEAGDHVRTERLLELDVWESDGQRAELRRLRDSNTTPSREMLLSQIDELEHEIAQLIDVDVDEGRGNESVSASLSRLRNQIRSEPEVNLADCRRELLELRPGSMTSADGGENRCDLRQEDSVEHRLGRSVGEHESSVDIFED